VGYVDHHLSIGRGVAAALTTLILRVNSSSRAKPLYRDLPARADNRRDHHGLAGRRSKAGSTEKERATAGIVYRAMERTIIVIPQK
jgi:hypothetical protein